VDECTTRIDDLLSHVPIGHRLNTRSEQRQAILAVLGDVQIDLAVEIVADGISPAWQKEARERA
jgi:hypothetical protein